NPVKILGRRVAVALLFLVAIEAQTLEQAESLRRARKYNESNEVFKALEKKDPKNADVKAAWGRLYLDNHQPDEAENLFQEALGIKQDHAGALLGLAEIAADQFEARAGQLARRALESDPKLVAAQELIAR